MLVKQNLTLAVESHDKDPVSLMMTINVSLITELYTLRSQQINYLGISFNKSVWAWHNISLKFDPGCAIHNKSALVQVMAWHHSLEILAMA